MHVFKQLIRIPQPEIESSVKHLPEEFKHLSNVYVSFSQKSKRSGNEVVL